MPILKEVPKEFTIGYAMSEINRKFSGSGRLVRLLQFVGAPVGQHFKIDYYRRSIVLILPVGDEFHEIVWHVSERRWATPVQKAEEHFKAAVNSARSFFKGLKRRKIKNRTYFLVCASYTRSVREKRKRITDSESAFVIPYREGDWIKDSIRRLTKLFFRRLKGAKKAAMEKNVRPYGGLKSWMNDLSFLIECLTLLFIDEVPPHAVARRLAGKG